MNQQPDKLFREKLEGFQKTVPAGAWNNVEARLNKKKHKGLWLKVAASLLLMALVTFLLWPDKMQTNQPKQLSQTDIEKESVVPEKKAEPLTEQPAADPKKADRNTATITKEPVSKRKAKTKKKDTNRSLQHNAATSQQVTTIEKQEEKILQSQKEVAASQAVETLPGETLMASNKNAYEDEGVTLILSAEQVNEKYLNKKSLAQATTDDKKTSTLRKLLDKAYDLKHNQDPLGDLRQKKNEILALNFRSEKQRSQNK